LSYLIPQRHSWYQILGEASRDDTPLQVFLEEQLMSTEYDHDIPILLALMYMRRGMFVQASFVAAKYCDNAVHLGIAKQCWPRISLMHPEFSQNESSASLHYDVYMQFKLHDVLPLREQCLANLARSPYQWTSWASLGYSYTFDGQYLMSLWCYCMVLANSRTADMEVMARLVTELRQETWGVPSLWAQLCDLTSFPQWSDLTCREPSCRGVLISSWFLEACKTQVDRRAAPLRRSVMPFPLKAISPLLARLKIQEIGGHP